MTLQQQRLSLQAPRGLGLQAIADTLVSILQHRRVRRLELLPTGEILADILLQPGESPEPIPDLPEDVTPVDMLRRMPRFDEVPFGSDLAESVFSVYRKAATDQVSPLCWLAAKAPRLSSPANAHFMDRADFEMGGYPGYVGDVPAGTLVLFCGMERGVGLRAANSAYRLQVPLNLIEAFLWK